MLLPWNTAYEIWPGGRSHALTMMALATVVMLVFVVVGFIRGLEQSLAVSGEKDVVLVYSVNSEENLENSSIPSRTPELLAASLSGTVKRFGVTHASPELYTGTRIANEDNVGGLGIVRGVTLATPLVRRSVQLIDGSWPASGEVIVGRLVATKWQRRGGVDDWQTARVRRRRWRISGRFSAGDSVYESEVWCNLSDFQTATKRQDISLVALLLSAGTAPAEVELFCKERTDLELRATPERDYYATLQQHYQPVRQLAWLVVWLVSGAGVFTGLNMMYGAVAGRVREIATLQAIGYRRRAVLLSLIQEGVLLSMAGSLCSGIIALTLLNGMSVRFTMERLLCASMARPS